MNEKLLKTIIFTLAVIMIFLTVLLTFKKFIPSPSDTISYNGKTYVYLEYNMDIFCYDFNGNGGYFEVDEICPVEHDKWDAVYFNGDLFVVKDQVKEAIAYYADDNNYKWSFILDIDDSEVEIPISINKEELKYLYNMEDMKREETMLFSEIQKFGTIKKTSHDNFISAIICLAYYKDSWYWRTETIDISQAGDPEYVIPLPKSLNNKINRKIDDML